VNDSASFSSDEPVQKPGGMVASRPQSDHLSLTGRGGQGVVAYRSEFLHLWLLGAPDSDAASVSDVLADLERAALDVPPGAMPPPGVALPLEVQHALSGLQFLHDVVWERMGIAGMLFFQGRAWALHTMLETSLEQMTGAPVRWRWLEWDGAAPLAYVELAAGEVWRLELPLVDGGLVAHYRPTLHEVVPTEADAFAAAAQAQAHATEPAHESRRARRRRNRQRPSVVPPPSVEMAEVATPMEVAPPVEVAVARPPKPARPPAPPRQVSTPRVAKPKLARKHLLVAGAASVLVLVAIAVGLMARRPITAIMVGHYALELTTSPAGARVRVDGKPVKGRTPLTVELAPGEHRVDVAYGEYANASFTVDGSRGDRRTKSFAWTGALGVASADSTVRLQVALDGQPIGTAPLWRESIPVGRHRLGFRAAGVRAWEEEVQVKAGQSARVTATPVKVPPYGLVTARAELVSSDGVEDLEGIPVFVDGERVGVTPVDLKLTPGPHSIRLARDAGAPSIHLIDVQAGGRFFASAEFGRPADPQVAFEPPARLSRAAPGAIAVRLAADLPLPIRQASLHLKPAGGDWARLPIAWTNGSGSFTFPLERMPAAKAVSFYVEIETREGEEYFSEVRTLPIVP